MAAAGMDPVVAAERAGHTHGGAIFLRAFRHFDEAEKRTQALRLEAKILADLATIWTDGEPETGNPLNEAGNSDGRTWDRTRAKRKPLRTTSGNNAPLCRENAKVRSGHTPTPGHQKPLWPWTRRGHGLRRSDEHRQPRLLLHHQGRSWAEIARFVGQRKLSLTADTDSHVMIDAAELNYGRLVA